MRRIKLACCFAALLFTAFSASAQHVRSDDLSMLLRCVRSSAHDMLGKEFKSGDEVHLRYVFSNKDVGSGERVMYLAVLTKDRSFGRIFRLSEVGGHWSVTNDANFETRPTWKLTSDPLGGIYTLQLLNKALAGTERAEDHTLRLSASTKQPSQCSTYVQFFDKKK